MENLYESLSALPHELVAAFVLIVGGVTAVILRLAVVRLLHILRFNHLCDRMGTTDFLRKGGISFPPAELAGRFITGLFLIGVFFEAARLLDIAAIHSLRQRAGAALPGILSSCLVLAVGLMIVFFLAGFLRTVVRNAGNSYANLWSRIARWTGIVLVLILALEQADIQGTILPGAIQIVIAAVAFGLALAFGLGCKDMARNTMEKFIADLKERHRDETKPDMEG